MASGLVLALATTTAGAAPAETAQVPSSTAWATTSIESIDPTFVQEGMPSPRGGQVVGWGDRSGGSTPRALPDGVYATAIATDDHALLVLRSDGRVDSHEYGLSPGYAHQLPDPPDGTRYTAVSADWFGAGRLLRSDGVVVSLSGRVVMTPPGGLMYTAISGELALRSDGVLELPGDPDTSCSDARDPSTGLRYTAVSARSGLGNWAALRSDGMIVYCRDGIEKSTATVVEPPTGTSFVGVDMGQSEAIGATADGQVISSDGSQRAVAPAGRSIVSLAAMGYGQGAAALDDGTIINWGLGGDDAAPPAIPAERMDFSAVSGYAGYDQHWAIMVGDPVPVEVSVQPTLPADRPLRVTDPVKVSVTASLADGTPVTGQVETTVRAPDGQLRTLEPKTLWPSSADIYLMRRVHEQIGTYAMAVTFAGSPYVTTTIENSLNFVEPSPVVLTTSGPTTWRQGTESTLCFRLATKDGSPLWWENEGQATLSVDGDPSQIHKVYQPFPEGAPTESCMHYFALQPGTYTAHFGYEGWGEADSASWTGQVVVQPPVPTQVVSSLPTSWHYGQMPDYFEVDVLSDSLVPAGVAKLYLNDWTPISFGYSARLDGSGHGRISIGDEDELAPGTYPVVLRFHAQDGFADSSLKRTVTVEPALFTTTTPLIIGTAKVGSNLTAVPGTWSPTPTSYRYVWKVDGVAVTGATSSTFTVPASAAGKSVTVTVTGLKQYYESSKTSAPTTAVAPGTFTAPRPTITGTPKVGKTLTVSRGTWSPTPSSVKYVWKANGVTISTRTSNTFVVPASAKGKRLAVTVTGSRAGYTTRSVTSTATATVAPGTFTAPRPTITGTKRVGSTLTVSKGSWSPAPSSVTYVWKADGVRIATRTSSRFVIPASARGKHLTVTVVGSRTGYTTKSVTSDRTSTIR